MSDTLLMKKNERSVSGMAASLIGSEIIKLASDIREKIKDGEKIYNYTIGDFDPKIFSIPPELTEEIIKAYRAGHTNYPAANGMQELRTAVSKLLSDYLELNYDSEDILISGGARPLIYGTYMTLLDADDKVIVPLPSWNNNHYCHLSHANPVYIVTKPENNFMPVVDEIRPHIKDATLLALCSPLNPTGTVFAKEQLEKICDLVIEENNSRGEGSKPLYLLYDQIYWVLTHGETVHYNPVSLRPEMKKYTVFIDGISKSLAATGIRVGWAFGPRKIIDKMKAILSHVGSWAPKAEQIAVSKYLNNREQMDRWVDEFKSRIEKRLTSFYNGFKTLREANFMVDAIAPQAAIYLTVMFDLCGMTKPDGTKLATQKDVTDYILSEAKLAIVPFSAFGSSDDSKWYRLSVGTCNSEEIPEVFKSLRVALEKLKNS